MWVSQTDIGYVQPHAKAASPMLSGNPTRWEAWAGWSRCEGATLTHTPACFTRHPVLPTPPWPRIPSLHPCRHRKWFLCVSGAQADRVRTPGFLLSHHLLHFILFLSSLQLIYFLSYCVFSFQAMSPVSMASTVIFIPRTSEVFDQAFFSIGLPAWDFYLDVSNLIFRHHQFKWIIPPNELISSRLLLPQCSL